MILSVCFGASVLSTPYQPLRQQNMYDVTCVVSGSHDVTIKHMIMNAKYLWSFNITGGSLKIFCAALLGKGKNSLGVTHAKQTL